MPLFNLNLNFLSAFQQIEKIYYFYSPVFIEKGSLGQLHNIMLSIMSSS